MTYPPSGPVPATGQQDPPSTPQVAKQQAAEVGQTAAQGGEQVMRTVGEQARRVAGETGAQARDLMDQGRRQLTEQAREGQQKAAQGLHALADQLDDMAAKSEESGIGRDVVQQAAGHTRNVASWLDDRQPGDLLNEVRSFARRKPGVFLAGAAVAGVLVGRLTRGVVAATKEESESDTPEPAPRPAPQQGGQQQPPSFQATNPAVDQTAYAPTQPVAPQYAAPPAPSYSQPPAQDVQGAPPAWHGPGTVRP